MLGKGNEERRGRDGRKGEGKAEGRRGERRGQERMGEGRGGEGCPVFLLSRPGNPIYTWQLHLN